jgi:hypothetical protein
MAPGQQVYIMRGRWARRHAKYLAALPLQRDFCIVQLFTVQGEISSDRDIVPLAYIRPSFTFEAADGDEGD